MHMGVLQKEKGKSSSIATQNRTSMCDVKIPELQEKNEFRNNKQSSNVAHWERLNKNLKEEFEILSQFPKARTDY